MKTEVPIYEKEYIDRSNFYGVDNLLAIEGSGAAGIHMLGCIHQLQRINQLYCTGYAGTSSGALIAFALWSGLSPRQFLEVLISKSSPSFGLQFYFMSYSDILEFVSSSSKALFRGFQNYLAGKAVDIANRRRKRANQFTWQRLEHDGIGCHGSKFRSFIREVFHYGLKLRGISDAYIEMIFGAKFDSNLVFKFEDIVNLERSLNTISMKLFTDRQYIEGNNIPSDLRNSYFDLIENNEKILLNDVIKLVVSWNFKRFSQENIDNKSEFERIREMNLNFKPLFLSVTKIDPEKGTTAYSGEIIASVYEKYKSYDVLSCVFTSCAYPAAFRPVKLKAIDTKYESTMHVHQYIRYTDGWIADNLPMLAVHDFKQTLTNKGSFNYIFEQQESFVKVMAVTGLRFGSANKSKAATKSLLILQIKLALGIAKLSSGEHKTAYEKLYFDKIRENGFVGNILIAEMPRIKSYEFWKLRHLKLLRIFDNSKQYARTNIQINRFYRPSEETNKTLKNISDLFTTIILNENYKNSIVGRIKSFNIRLFLINFRVDKEKPTLDEYYFYSSIGIQVPHKPILGIFAPSEGLIGFSYSEGRPLIANILNIETSSKKSPAKPFLGKTWTETADVYSGADFCICIPISLFQSSTIKADGKENLINIGAVQQELKDSIHVYGDQRLGSIIGVLSIDIYMKKDDTNPNVSLDNFTKNVEVELLYKNILETCTLLSKSISNDVQDQINKPAQD